MPLKRILILGGTRDARELAAGLLAEGFSVITSLAGVTGNPVLPEGEVRIGGFGGTEGLVRYLRDAGISTIMDATHPFAAQMSAHAADAAREADVPLLRLERPAWVEQPGDRWTSANSAAEATAVLPSGARALVTIGRKEIGAFFTRNDIAGVARMIEPPPSYVPASWRVMLERPPFTLEHERELIIHHHITHLVTKNAGGEDTAAKLQAARVLGIPVIMIERPHKPEAVSFPTAREMITAHRAMLLP
jgi:precorrin-6A/cobalt-precorrin-6A reductase